MQTPLPHNRQAAQARDAADPLAPFRAEFDLPRHTDGTAAIYFNGNSLGARPKAAVLELNRVLDQWAQRGVENWFEGNEPWVAYPERLRDNLAALVGAQPGEVIAMNSLTVNLHLLLASFYRPTAKRPAILIEDDAFCSDSHAVRSQIAYHGFNPEVDLIRVKPRPGERALREEDILAAIAANANRLALVLLGAVNYATGQWFDLKTIAAAGQKAGAVVGFDCAHAIGNVPLDLHATGADFAVWCHYKYVNAGPGAIGGAFVHELHANAPTLPRLAGWWGHQAATRFLMDARFTPEVGAAGWQVSTPALLALAPLKASLERFQAAGMEALREKSVALTGFLEELLQPLFQVGKLELLTPKAPKQRGCQLSLVVPGGRGKAVFEQVSKQGLIADWREPDVIRVAPVPLYNTFEECWRCAELLHAALG